MLYDAVIIGAGPAGSSLAAVLARQGWKVRLLEQQPRFGHKVCGEFVSWEAQDILRSLGLYGQVQAAAPAALKRAVITSRSGVSAKIPLGSGSWGLSRRALDSTLAGTARSAGAELSLGTRVLRFQQVNGGYEVEARANGRPLELECRALFAACGRVGSAELPPRPQTAFCANPPASRRTSVRPPRSRTSSAEPSPRTAARLIGIKQHYANLRMPAQVELFFFDGGYVGLAPIEGEAVNLCLLASQESLRGAGGDPAGLINALAARLPALAARLKGAVPVHPAPLAAAPVDLWRTAEPWDSIPCVGDAAAMIPPLAGDGIAAALRSVELCAPLAHDYLRGELTLEQWKRLYRRTWHASFDRPLAVARRLETWLGARLFSDLLLGVGALFPPAAGKLAKLTRSRPIRPRRV